MARRLSLNILLLGVILAATCILGGALFLGLSSMIRSVQETTFIDRARVNAFEYTDTLASSINLQNEQDVVEFLDQLLLRSDVSYAHVARAGKLHTSSIGFFNQTHFAVDQRLSEHGDSTFFIELPIGFDDAFFLIGFDEELIQNAIEKMRARIVAIIILFGVVWMLMALFLEAYLKARFRVLQGMAKDISLGRPLRRRRFLLDEMDNLALSIAAMEKELRIREENMQYMVAHDALTGVPNRYQFNRYLHDILLNPRRVAPFAVILVDIDKFKLVNDIYGHLLGDRLIKFLGVSLQRVVGKLGLAARMGGDEFAVILDYRDDISLDKFCRLVHEKIARSILLRGVKLNISLSMGVVTCQPLERDIALDDMVHRADMALYQAKRENMSVSYHDEGMIKENQRFKEIVRGFQSGEFKGRDSGIEAYFQPKYSLVNGDILGVEALVRWFHPRMGYLEATDILAAAEEANMMEQLTFRVVDLVIEAQCFWRENGFEIPVALNIPPSALATDNFGRTLHRKLDKAELNPQNIEIEITEHAVLEQDERVYKRLDELKASGFSITIDDFGVGYANFRNLRNYPFSTIKIDQDFIAEILVNPRDRVIVQATTQIAKDLNMDVIAEGIEDASVIPELIKLDCLCAQGYLFSRAVDRQHILFLMSDDEVSNLILASQNL